MVTRPSHTVHDNVIELHFRRRTGSRTLRCWREKLSKIKVVIKPSAVALDLEKAGKNVRELRAVLRHCTLALVNIRNPFWQNRQYIACYQTHTNQDEYLSPPIIFFYPIECKTWKMDYIIITEINWLF